MEMRVVAAPEPSSSPRIPLTRDRVLWAAIQLADQSGIESLSMRRLGQDLGVEAMSLYNHVANKDDLLDGIADLVVGEIEVPAPGENWKTTIRGSAISAYNVLSRHPWACGLMMSPARVRPARLRFMEGLLGTLRVGGFSAGMTRLAYHALDSHILGFTMWEASYTAGSEDAADLASDFLRELSLADYPSLAEHVQEHIAPSAGNGVSEFEFGLDFLLDGLQRLLEAS
jgi:AcrR family transcriptional regulator